MTENAKPSKSAFVSDFKALKPKHIGIIIATMLLILTLVYWGMLATMCMGFLILAVLLYMIPHISGVMSPYVKGVMGVVFFICAVCICMFAYNDISPEDKESIPESNVVLTGMEYDDGFVVVYVTDPTYGPVDSTCAPVTVWAFGIAGTPSNQLPTNIPLIFGYDPESGAYTAEADLEPGKYYYIGVTVSNDSKKESGAICINTGMTQKEMIEKNTYSSLMYVAYMAAIFFVLLIVSALMRKSAAKTRTRMEEEGRIYPAGYDKCKNCGTMVLPGEITCRKCGAPIEVPEELKVLHKKDFFECSECGTEVPIDAKVCPKCGAKFDEETENIIKHADGTVDSSTDTFECSECGKVVPANAKRCPYCGAEFDEDE